MQGDVYEGQFKEGKPDGLILYIYNSEFTIFFVNSGALKVSATP